MINEANESSSTCGQQRTRPSRNQYAPKPNWSTKLLLGGVGVKGNDAFASFLKQEIEGSSGTFEGIDGRVALVLSARVENR